MVQGILIIVLFLLIAALMVTRKIPTLLALPILAIGICIIAGLPVISIGKGGKDTGFLTTVIEAGALKMGAAYMAVIFGSWLGQLLNKTGVTETIIKKSAELGGDSPLVMTLILVVAVALLFTTLSGLGSIIMVGNIVLPIFVSIGIPAVSAGCIFLMAFATGLALNISNWQTFITIFGVSTDQVRNFEIIMMVCTLLATLVLIFVEFRRNGVKFAFSAPVSADAKKENEPEIKGVRGVLAMITPLIPILLVAVFKVPILSAFLVGIAWILIFTSRGFSKAMNLLTKTCYDGISDAGPAVILMVGIGMLYLAVTDATVKKVLAPIMQTVVPHSTLPFILFFVILAPLALYRGPLNLFGLGSGIAALIVSLKVLPTQAVMGAFLSVERMQGVGDPTNTQNVWTANYVGIDVNSITKKLIPYLWVITAVGVICASILYF